MFILAGGGGGVVGKKVGILSILRADKADAEYKFVSEDHLEIFSTLSYMINLPVARFRGWKGICHVLRCELCPLHWWIQGRGPLSVDQTEPRRAEKNVLEIELSPPLI